MVPGRYFLPEVMGTGLAWIDFDGDGWLDLFCGNGCPLDPLDPQQTQTRSRLYRNMAAERFVDVTVESQGWDRGYAQGCAVGDYDADGFPDLFIACYGHDALLRNNGDGTFSTVTAAAGVGDEQWSSSAAWFDADADGDLDLYVVNYLDVTLANRKVCRYGGQPGYCGPGDFQPVPDRLWRNRGDGTFDEALEELGLAIPNGKGLAIVVLDLDRDLRPEIYVGNDMDANSLFTRGDSPLAGATADPPRPWAEVGMAAGCAVSGMGLNEASMGISCADFDGDGWPDLYLTHYFNSKNTLYRNLGELRFADDSFRSRAAVTSFQSLGFGTVPLDFDRDGRPDLFVANGHVLGPEVPPFAMRPQLLWNDGMGRLFSAESQAGDYFQAEWLGRCVAAADYDHDGDLDVAVSHLAAPVALLRNDTATGRHALSLDLRTRSRVPPVGGRVEVRWADRTITVPVQAGGSYLATHDPRLIVGTGEQSDHIALTIYWPSGKVQEMASVTTAGRWIVYEGEDLQSAPPISASAAATEEQR